MSISDWSSDVCSSDLTSDLSACAADALTAARANKSALENELPASLVQLTEQVEYGRQFQQALEQYCGKQAEEAALQARPDIRERWKASITKAASLCADTEATLSRAKIADRSAAHTCGLQSHKRISYAVFRLQQQQRIP